MPARKTSWVARGFLSPAAGRNRAAWQIPPAAHQLHRRTSSKAWPTTGRSVSGVGCWGMGAEGEVLGVGRRVMGAEGTALGVGCRVSGKQEPSALSMPVNDGMYRRAAGREGAGCWVLGVRGDSAPAEWLAGMESNSIPNIAWSIPIVSRHSPTPHRLPVTLHSALHTRHFPIRWSSRTIFLAPPSWDFDQSARGAGSARRSSCPSAFRRS